MRSRKIGLLVLAVLIAATFFTSSAGAANAWYSCKVRATGPLSGKGVYFYLQPVNGEFAILWFKALAGEENRQLAVALTAMTNGWTVRVYTDPSLDQENRILTSIYTYDH